MSIRSLFDLLGHEPPAAEGRKLHAAFFLAQSSSGLPAYSFSLQRGRVRSEQFDQDLVLVYVAGYRNISLAQADEPHCDFLVTFKESYSWLLEEEDEVLEAAATSRYFRLEGLGDPSAKLRWFGALSPEIVRRAATLEKRVPA